MSLNEIATHYKSLASLKEDEVVIYLRSLVSLRIYFLKQDERESELLSQFSTKYPENKEIQAINTWAKSQL